MRVNLLIHRVCEQGTCPSVTVFPGEILPVTGFSPRYLVFSFMNVSFRVYLFEAGVVAKGFCVLISHLAPWYLEPVLQCSGLGHAY